MILCFISPRRLISIPIAKEETTLSYRKLGRIDSKRKALLRDLTTDLIVNSYTLLKRAKGS